LAEGKATLPLIHAMSRADDATRARLRAVIEQGDTDAMPEVLAAIEEAGSLEYSRKRARDHAAAAEAALAGLPENEATAARRLLGWAGWRGMRWTGGTEAGVRGPIPAAGEAGYRELTAAASRRWANVGPDLNPARTLPRRTRPSSGTRAATRVRGSGSCWPGRCRPRARRSSAPRR